MNRLASGRHSTIRDTCCMMGKLLLGDFGDDIQSERFGIGPIAHSRIEIVRDKSQRNAKHKTECEANWNIETSAQRRRRRGDDNSIKGCDDRSCAILREDKVVALLQHLEGRIAN